MKRIIYLILLISGIFSLSACAVFSGRRNTLPPTPLVNIKPTIQVRQLWSAKISRGANKYYLRLSPIIVGNTIFTADYRGKVIAVNRNTGEILWTINVGTYITSGICASNGKLFVGTENGEAIALQQSDGAQLWRTPIGNEILAAPAASQELVFVKSIDGSLTALSQDTGQQQWQFTQEVPSLILHISSQPQVVGNLVIAGFSNGKLAAININTGKARWTKSIATPRGTTVIEQMIDIDISPVVVKGIVYVATYQGKIAALDLMTGRLIWMHTVSAYAGIAADYKQLYLSDANSYLWAFDEDTGAVLWRQNQLKGRMITGPALVGKYVIVADYQGYLHWMSKDSGEFVARNRVSESGILAAPIVKGKTLYVYTLDGVLAAYREIG